MDQTLTPSEGKPPFHFETALLIGGNGYIGRALAPLLVQRGTSVTVLSRTPALAGMASNGIRHVTGEYGDPAVIAPLLDTHQLVVHLAYATVPNTSFDSPLLDLTENLVPAVGLFDGIAARGRLLVLISSGGTVYGEARQIPVSEDHPLHPISPYGVTKLTLENYAHLYSVTKGLRYICIRPANAFGPGQRPFAGQGFIATAFGCAMLERPISVFGEYGTVRDYLYIDDLARGLADIVTCGALSQTYNLGSGVGRSNLDVIDAINSVVHEDGLRLDIEHLPARPFDVAVNILNASKATRATGWSPTTTFEQGLRATYEWLRTQPVSQFSNLLGDSK